MKLRKSFFSKWKMSGSKGNGGPRKGSNKGRRLVGMSLSLLSSMTGSDSAVDILPSVYLVCNE